MEKEQRALLDDIIANPDDDNVRLVYADWLDDHHDLSKCGCTTIYSSQRFHGSPVPGCSTCDGTGVSPKNRLHAELIRVQIELAKQTAKSADLILQQDAVLDRAAYWILNDPCVFPVRILLGPIGGPYRRAWFHRGFVRRWMLSMDAWIAHHRDILSRHPIREIVISSFGNTSSQSGSHIWLERMPPINKAPYTLGKCVYTLCAGVYWPAIKFSVTQEADNEVVRSDMPLVEPIPEGE